MSPSPKSHVVLTGLSALSVPSLKLKSVKITVNGITPTFLSTYIHTMGRILYNVLEQNRNTYKALSDELKLPLQMPALYEEVDDQGIPSARAFVIQQVVKAMKKNTQNVS